MRLLAARGAVFIFYLVFLTGNLVPLSVWADDGTPQGEPPFIQLAKVLISSRILTADGRETGYFQTALKPGGSFSLFLEGIGTTNFDTLTVTADLSEFGLGNAVDIPYIGRDASYQAHQLDGLMIPPNMPDGVKAISLAVSSAIGTISNVTISLTVDGTAPTASISAFNEPAGANFIADGPATLSGALDGTGSDPRILNERYYELAIDGSRLGVWNYTQIDALESLRNGPFASIPFSLGELRPGTDALQFVIDVVDAAGNHVTATSSPVSVAATVAATTTQASSVLFLPGTEASRLYFRDLLGVEHQVWEPDLFTDIPALALDASGASQYDLYTKDIMDSTFGNKPVERAALSAVVSASNRDVYGGFEEFLDGLVATSTIREWRAYPYDWRYNVRDVVTNGTMTQIQGSVSRVYLADVLREMASSSPTHKVTVIGHSNGGLLAKALAISLGDDAATYIDRIILVGSPQWGTPMAIGALLHSDNFARMPAIVINPLTTREVASNMPDSYDLLPSAAYFSHIASPVVTFESSGASSGVFASQLGSALASFSSLGDFLADPSGLDLRIGDLSDIHAPYAVSSTLLAKAAATHAELDAWIPPAGISVTAIAGWGQLTASGLAYRTASKAVCTSIGLFSNACQNVPTLRHELIVTQDGDGTVVSPSAVGNFSDVLYFNSKDFSDQNLGNIIHRNILSAAPVQEKIFEILTNTPLSTSDFIKTSLPIGGESPLTVISAHSPVNLLATDDAGNRSGVVSIPGKDFSVVREDIPGSSVKVLGDEKYIYVPAGTSYQVTGTGYALGSASLEVGSVNPDGSIHTVKSFESLPVTANTLLSLSVPADAGENSTLTIDEDGDGQEDASLSLTTGNLSYEPPAATTSAPVSHSSTASNHVLLFPSPSTSTPKTSVKKSLILPVLPHESLVRSASIIASPKDELSEAIPPQTASALSGLSSALASGALHAVYHWMQSAWQILIQFVKNLL